MTYPSGAAAEIRLILGRNPSLPQARPAVMRAYTLSRLAAIARHPSV